MCFIVFFRIRMINESRVNRKRRISWKLETNFLFFSLFIQLNLLCKHCTSLTLPRYISSSFLLLSSLYYSLFVFPSHDYYYSSWSEIFQEEDRIVYNERLITVGSVNRFPRFSGDRFSDFHDSSFRFDLIRNIMAKRFYGFRLTWQISLGFRRLCRIFVEVDQPFSY